MEHALVRIFTRSANHPATDVKIALAFHRQFHLTLALNHLALQRLVSDDVLFSGSGQFLIARYAGTFSHLIQAFEDVGVVRVEFVAELCIVELEVDKPEQDGGTAPTLRIAIISSHHFPDLELGGEISGARIIC